MLRLITGFTCGAGLVLAVVFVLPLRWGRSDRLDGYADKVAGRRLTVIIGWDPSILNEVEQQGTHPQSAAKAASAGTWDEYVVQRYHSRTDAVMMRDKILRRMDLENER